MDLEKTLRRAASEGKSQDLNMLLKDFNVNINAQDNNLGKDPKIGKKTALHWVIIRANETDCNDKLIEYKQCLQILLDHKADCTLRDAAGKIPEEYNRLPMFQEIFQAASLTNKLPSIKL